jgi:CRP-like cAMP-binding protein
MLESKVAISRELFLRSFFGAAVTPSSWTIDRLTRVIEESEVREGDVLFREGETPDRIYFIENGNMRVTRAGAPSFRYTGRWVLGMIDLLADRPRRHTLTALKPSRIASVRGEEWIDIIEDTLDVAKDAVAAQLGATSRLYAKLEVPRFPAPEPSPPPPAARLTLFERLLAFFDSPILRRAGVQTLSLLAESSREIRLEAGERLTNGSARPTDAYLVAHGEIETSQPGRFGRGTFVSGAALLSAGWEAHAAVPSVVLALPFEEWFDAMEEHFDLARSAMTWNALERERIYESLASKGDEPTFE